MSPKNDPRTLKQVQHQAPRHWLDIQLSNTVISYEAKCPKCNEELSLNDVKQGWECSRTHSPTKCPKCGISFQANIKVKVFDEDPKSYLFLCPAHLANELKKARKASGKLGRLYLYDYHPALFYNLILHYSSYENGIRVMNRMP